MNWKCTDEEMQAQQAEYRKNYPAWRPYPVMKDAIQHLVEQFLKIIPTQNGQDTDDYSMNEHHKIYKYIKDIPVYSEILFLGTGTAREVCAAIDVNLNAHGLTLGNRNTYFAQVHLGLSHLIIREGLNECIPWEKESFDYVHGYQVFEHAIAPLIFLLEIGRVLRPQGQILLEWPPGKDYSMGANPHHQICYTPGQAVALLEKAGFINISCTKDNGDPIPDNQFWRNDQDYMLVVRGTKTTTPQEYVERAWNL